MAIVSVRQITSLREVDNVEFHNKQIVLKRNAREEYSKYNFSLPTKYSKVRYSSFIKKRIKTGTKYDKSQLAEDEFWVGRTYKKGSGKSTCYMESMVFAPPFKIKPEELDDFMHSEEVTIFQDFYDYLKTSERFKDCIILGFDVHCNEIYYPQTTTDEDGKEVLLTEEQSKALAYCKPHAHISMIPLVRSTDKDGNSFLKLSRGDVWKSKKGKFTESYSEELDEMFEAVFRKYGLERGEIRKDMPEDERPVEKLLEDWQRETDIKTYEKLAQQEEQELEEKKKALEAARVIHNQKVELLQERKEDIADQITNDVAEWGAVFESDYDKVDREVLKNENIALVKALNIVDKVLASLESFFPSRISYARGVIKEVLDKISIDDIYKNEINLQKDFLGR